MVEDKQCLTFGNTTICVFRGHVMIYIYHNMSMFWLAVFARPDAIKTVKELLLDLLVVHPVHSLSQRSFHSIEIHTCKQFKTWLSLLNHFIGGLSKLKADNQILFMPS